MKIKFKNKDLPTLINAITNVGISSMRVNRSRSKFLKRLHEKDQEYLEARIAVRDIFVKKEHQDLDKIEYHEGKDEKGFLAEIDVLMEEEIVIEGGEYSNRFQEFFDYLLEAQDVYLTGTEAIVLDHILEQYETYKEVKENNDNN